MSNKTLERGKRRRTAFALAGEPTPLTAMPWGLSIADIHIVTALLQKVVASHKTGKKAAAPAKFKRLQALAEEVRVEAKTRAEIVRQKIKRRKEISEFSVEEVRKNSY